MTAVRVSDDAGRAKTRDELVADVAKAMRKYRRYPAEWEAKRELAMREAFRAIDQINAMDRAAV